jgi:hypothetical protein
VVKETIGSGDVAGGTVVQTARWTLRAFRHFAQTFSRRGLPSTMARTRWTFGFHRLFDRRWEWLTFIPNPGLRPQTSHTDAMAGPA